MPTGGHTGLVAIDPGIAARAIRHDRERAQALLAVLGAVDDGDLAADGSAGAAMVQQLRGALAALAALNPGTESEGVKS